MCYIHCYLISTQLVISWDSDATTESYLRKLCTKTNLYRHITYILCYVVFACSDWIYFVIHFHIFCILYFFWDFCSKVRFVICKKTILIDWLIAPLIIGIVNNAVFHSSPHINQSINQFYFRQQGPYMKSNVPLQERCYMRTICYWTHGQHYL